MLRKISFIKPMAPTLARMPLVCELLGPNTLVTACGKNRGSRQS
jgi:hypothetical protein